MTSPERQPQPDHAAAADQAAAAEQAETDVAALRESTDALLAAAERLTADGATEEQAVTASSTLPGWTRGHVLTHLARNADALVNVLEGRPMYRSAEAREADIERGSARPLGEQLHDIRATAERLDRAFAQYHGERWQRLLELRGGVKDTASAIPFRRQVEIELHHLDLGSGRTPEDLPAEFTSRLIAYLAKRFTGNSEVPAIELRAEDGRTWRTGRPINPGGPDGEGDATGPVVITGTPAALAGWLAGRTTGTGLTASSGQLPPLPPL
ncbi:maleylpyruvate isomerase family mycothiol-dependent enzyme [Streptomyces sp. JJ66]|uniref:maleylpyruvate isomerase family mycothiol-dependent enzyme n=1 Tax=Streptomyces sp. JJ66 TaxID=2803843 RepID=UPI001C56FB41|nr:maleylpyruvate isomerase family mycothiol-dependent enzyme [Streptomyces sp. JJ66]MBW1602885.1 maleylpyruvate isomerase family mycothiol-dependent enzyme [Streptomyces sp. JJ66]